MTPLSMWIPNGHAISTIAVVITTLFTNSEYSRPSTIADREIGVARSLSK